MADMRELAKKVNPAGVDPRVLFMQAETGEQAKDLVESALQAEMETVRKNRSSLYRFSSLGILAIILLVFLRGRTEQETVKLILFAGIAFLILTLLPMMTQIRRFKNVLEDEEHTLGQIREGKIDAADFLEKFRAHKEEDLSARGLKEEYETYRNLWEESEKPDPA